MPVRSAVFFLVLLALLLALLVALVPGCVPDTHLVDEAGPGAPGAPGVPGGALAAAVLVDPTPGAVEVPPNLDAVVLRFAGPVTAADGAVTLTGPNGERAATGLPEGVPCAAGAAGCLRVPVLAPLAPSASYLVALGDGLVTGDGGPIAGGPVAEFGTAAEVDLHAPGIDGLAVEPAGPCVNVRFETDEPATATVTLAGDGLRQDVAAGAGARQFSLAAPLGAFPPATALELTVAVRDRAGNTAASPAVPLTTPAGLLPLAITEVHANAAGPEPAQEFVEIRNLGGAPVELGAVAIADARGMDLLPAGTLASGAYALIVPSGFDAAAAAGLGLGGGTPLVRVDARIGGDGLGNSGEVTELRAVADGALISGYRFPVDVSAAGWSGKSVHRVPEDACDQQASWTRAPADATPGRGPP